MMKNILSNINKASFWVCLVSSMGFGLAGFMVPPMGVIDGSVLKLIGILFLFATLGTVIVAIDKGSDISLRHGDFEVNVNNEESQSE